MMRQDENGRVHSEHVDRNGRFFANGNLARMGWVSAIITVLAVVGTSIFFVKDMFDQLSLIQEQLRELNGHMVYIRNGALREIRDDEKELLRDVRDIQEEEKRIEVKLDELLRRQVRMELMMEGQGRQGRN